MANIRKKAEEAAKELYRRLTGEALPDAYAPPNTAEDRVIVYSEAKSFFQPRGEHLLYVEIPMRGLGGLERVIPPRFAGFRVVKYKRSSAGARHPTNPNRPPMREDIFVRKDTGVTHG